MKRGTIFLLLVAILAGGGGFFLAMKLGSETAVSRVETAAAPTAESIVGRFRPDFRHLDAEGRWVRAGDFDGGALLLNFWATWCKPCVEEMPMLSRLQQDYAGTGLAVVGIAIDDAARAREFAEALELAYPVLLGETDVVLTGRRYGNDSGMLPYSVLVDTDGIVRWTHLGALDPGDLERELARLR